MHSIRRRFAWKDAALCVQHRAATTRLPSELLSRDMKLPGALSASVKACRRQQIDIRAAQDILVKMAVHFNVCDEHVAKTMRSRVNLLSRLASVIAEDLVYFYLSRPSVGRVN